MEIASIQQVHPQSESVEMNPIEEQEPVNPRIEEILKQYPKVFSESDQLLNLPRDNDTKRTPMKINLKPGTTPIKRRYYRTEDHKELKKQLEQMIESGLIQPSVSPWSSPVLLVKKKGWH